MKIRKRSVILTCVILISGIIVTWVASEPGGIKGFLFKQALPLAYFEPHRTAAEFEQVSKNIYAFRFGFNRGLVVDTEEGLAVFDTFNRDFAAALKEQIQESFPGKQVRWVFYSHHHLDHVGGAATLEPQEIVGHKDINSSFDDWPRADSFLRVTMPLQGDTEMLLGSTNLKLLYMPRSHSTTLYAFHFPEQDVVYAPDMMFVKAMPPFGFPDWYYPGYIRALDRIIALNASHYVPSHFARGSRADLIAYREMMVDFRNTVTQALARYEFDAASGTNLRAVFEEAYPELRDRYGEWHGFDAMFIPHFGGQAGGAYLGY